MARGDRFTVTVKGTRELQRLLDQFGERAARAAGASLRARAEVAMTRSQEDFVPVDTGVLKSTGHVVGPFFDARRVWVEMAYGGPAAPYALEQHENIFYHHAVGQAKYLEVPVLEWAKGAAGQVAADMRRELGL